MGIAALSGVGTRKIQDFRRISTLSPKPSACLEFHILSFVLKMVLGQLCILLLCSQNTPTVYIYIYKYIMGKQSCKERSFCIL